MPTILEKIAEIEAEVMVEKKDQPFLFPSPSFRWPVLNVTRPLLIILVY